ncbi:MAG: hypothetical protein IJI75_11140 [Solobacterium sp.]|nr:hypothetical protein [Solobacterium sp.]MBQ6489774.1 hypothetical protein [Solobacterium sp.]MDO4193206.1 hypothetical protein [Erysipelotrichaceae bacterium]
MKRNTYIFVTVLVMLGITRMAVRIIDATVGIDDDVLLLAVFLAVMNLILAWISRKLYRIIDKGAEQK